MSIQEAFDHFRNTVKGVAAVMMLDKDGEAVLMSIAPELETFDAQLFGAQLAVMMAKRIGDEQMDFVFFRADGKSAAARMLPNDFFLCVYFDEQSFAGYAEEKLKELAHAVTEEFF